MDYLRYAVAGSLQEVFKLQAQQKIKCEGWETSRREVKVRNFVNCWVTEEAFKQILIEKGVWFRNRGLYFGDAAGAGADFHVKMNGQEISVGIRSIGIDSLEKWKEVTYPDDRFREEKEKIADYHVVCTNEDGEVKFFGVISKDEMLDELENSKIGYSKRNQERFRKVPLDRFSYANLVAILEKIDKV